MCSLSIKFSTCSKLHVGPTSKQRSVFDIVYCPFSFRLVQNCTLFQRLNKEVCLISPPFLFAFPRRLIEIAWTCISAVHSQGITWVLQNEPFVFDIWLITTAFFGHWQDCAGFFAKILMMTNGSSHSMHIAISTPIRSLLRIIDWEFISHANCGCPVNYLDDIEGRVPRLHRSSRALLIHEVLTFNLRVCLWPKHHFDRILSCSAFVYYKSSTCLAKFYVGSTVFLYLASSPVVIDWRVMNVQGSWKTLSPRIPLFKIFLLKIQHLGLILFQLLRVLALSSNLEFPIGVSFCLARGTFQHFRTHFLLALYFHLFMTLSSIKSRRYKEVGRHWVHESHCSRFFF